MALYKLKACWYKHLSPANVCYSPWHFEIRRVRNVIFVITDTNRGQNSVFRTKMTFIWRILQSCTISHLILSYDYHGPYWLWRLILVLYRIENGHPGPSSRYKIPPGLTCGTRVPFLSSILDTRQLPWAFHRLQRPFWSYVRCRIAPVGLFSYRGWASSS